MKEKMLRINLSSGKFREEEIPDEVLRNYFGGICLGAKILFEELKPGIDALSPDNKLVFSAGLLTGVPFFANARYVAMAKSPLTNLWGHANSGGYFGPELRAAGYIALIIEGKARNPVYILIKDGGVEVRDARKIWGKFTGDVVDEIKKETGDERIRVACIGPAAEKLVRYACIINDYHHAAGRSGLGTVMASKNLKAVAVRGSKRVEIPNREAFTSIVKQGTKEIMDYTQDSYRKYGTDGGLALLSEMGILPTKAFRRSTFEHAREITGETIAEKIKVRNDTCYSCFIQCDRIVRTKTPYEVDERYAGPEYETVAALGSLLCNSNLDSIAKGHELCNKYGMDTISTGVCVAFAIECRERGILSKQELGGLDLDWGKHEGIIRLIEMIAKREGIGDLLAEGVMRASEKLGEEAEEIALHVKGQELPMHEPRGKKGVAIQYATSCRGACHLPAAHDTEFAGEMHLAPEIGIAKPLSPVVLDGDKARLVKILNDSKRTEDSLGFCDNPSYPYGIRIKTFKEIVNSITGFNLTIDEILRVGERAENLCRAFNVREGVRRSDDTLPKRLFEPLPDGPNKGATITREEFEKALTMYYKARGWDPETGVPKRKKLEELGLKFIADELERLGINS